MNLTATIVSVEATDPSLSDGMITFSMFDGEDTQQVAFVDSIAFPHAVFLQEHVFDIKDAHPYALMIDAIASCENFDMMNALVGKEFKS